VLDLVRAQVEILQILQIQIQQTPFNRWDHRSIYIQPIQILKIIQNFFGNKFHVFATPESNGFRFPFLLFGELQRKWYVLIQLNSFQETTEMFWPQVKP
jgi:hypothetical protein